jgi:hypothetical protein
MGIKTTAGVVTSAAAVMIAVFRDLRQSMMVLQALRT